MTWNIGGMMIEGETKIFEEKPTEIALTPPQS
jgi:hypothetical protein